MRQQKAVTQGISAEKAMAPHSSTLAWKIPRTEEPGGLQSMGSPRVMTERLHFHFHALEKKNGNPLQCSCLENPRDRGAQWAAVYGVAQSRTWLTQLSSSSSSSSIVMDSHLPQLFLQMPGILLRDCVIVYSNSLLLMDIWVISSFLLRYKLLK